MRFGNSAKTHNLTACSKWVDALIAISCFGVVCLHANGIFWSRPSGRAWFAALFIECLFYFCVPVFYMVSGYTLLGYRQRCSTKKFLSRRIKRTVVPYLFWSLLAYFALSIIQGRWYNGINSVTKFFVALVNSQIVGIYWFFPPLFMCYLMLPLLSLACSSKKLLSYLLALGIISYSLLPFFSKILGIEFSSVYLHILPGSGYMIFFIMGYVLGNNKFSTGVESLIIWLGGIGFLAHLVGTHYCSPIGADVGKLYKGYLNWPTVLYGAAIFILIKRVYDKYDFTCLHKIVAFVRRNSLGIYLLHWWILYIIVPKMYAIISSIYSWRENALWNILLAILTTIFCGLITEGIRRIRVLKWMIGE